MADFLTRLAQRALGIAPLVRPRTDSRDALAEPEPEPGTEWMPAADEAGPVPVAAQHAASENRPRAAGAGTQPEGRVTDSVAEPPKPQVETTAEPAEHETAARRAETRPPRVSAEAPRRDSRQPSYVAPSTGERPEARAKGEEQGDREKETEPAPARPGQHAASRPAAAAQPGSARTDAGERRMAKGGWRKAAGERPRPPDSRPVIHVTIGRVEVRAVQPQPAPQRPAPPRPKLTLEEYLRQRDKGER